MAGLLTVVGLVASLPSDDRPPVLWVHIHKSGGTAGCHMARAEGERSTRRSENCNSHELRDDLRGRGHGVGCRKRAAFARQSNATWMMIEHEVEDADLACSDEMLYGIMLRDPADFMASAVHHHDVTNLEYEFNLRRMLPFVLKTRSTAESEAIVEHDRTRLHGKKCKKHHGCFVDWRFLDNYAVRMLNGVEGLLLPPQGVTQQHLDKAKKLISTTFDVVVTLEHISRDFAQFQDVFGWSKLTAPKRSNARQHANLQSMVAKRLSKISDSSYAKLLELNALSFELYRHANETAASKSESSVQRLRERRLLKRE